MTIKYITFQSFNSLFNKNNELSTYISLNNTFDNPILKPFNIKIQKEYYITLFIIIFNI